MAQTPQYAGFLFTVWLLFAVSCLADKAPSASIEFTLGPQTQRRHRRSGQYGTSEVVYGPLVPRINGAHNQSELLGRAMPGEPGKDEYGPLITVPGCWFCPPIDIALKTGRALLDALDTATMQRYMRITDDSSLWNKCVFYTASTTKPNPEYLSEKASTWACSKNKLSVWHLWPNKVMATNQLGRFLDFYGIDDPPNWLESIKGLPLLDPNEAPTMIQYFENMSEAMAKRCGGEVVIMTQTPTRPGMAAYGVAPIYPNIWVNKEKPALAMSIKRNKVTRVLLVDYNDPDNIWEYDLLENQVGDLVPPSTLMSRDLHGNETDEARLLQRQACGFSSGLAQMPSQGDPFSDPYAQFA